MAKLKEVIDKFGWEGMINGLGSERASDKFRLKENGLLNGDYDQVKYDTCTCLCFYHTRCQVVIHSN